MQIMTSHAFAPVMRELPGTPVVAVDTEGKPVAIGACLSADPEQRQAELATFSSFALGHSKQAGDVARLLSSGIDLGAEVLPQYAHPASQATTVIAFAATSLSLYKEINDGDARSIGVAGFKCGADALNVIDEFFPGNPLVHTTALGAKLVSNALAIIPAKEPAKPQP